MLQSCTFDLGRVVYFSLSCENYNSSIFSSSPLAAKCSVVEGKPEEDCLPVTLITCNYTIFKLEILYLMKLQVIPEKKKILLVTIAVTAIVLLFINATKQPEVDFSADVKPIINRKCISCHGGVKKQAGFSLLFREEALDTTESGKPAIIPGHPSESEMIRRLTLKDPEERMPYEHEALSEAEIQIFTNWIKQGAKWGEHWAYKPVVKQDIPGPSSAFFGLVSGKKWDWVKNDIDYFVYDKLKQMEIVPSAEADKATLLKRVSLDVTGLPPMQSLSEKFLKDTSEKAYEVYVDSLLESPHYGERWAAMWMDIARYADTKGYERDSYRNMWKYRDWLIHAFNNNQPYNEFLIEQLAGDLLPDATDQQFIATAFHRNTMTNDEGGTDNEEFRTAAVMDRVSTTWEGLLSTTFGCVQCHSHPYDPFTHDEYYKFLAFFNNSRDEDTYEDYPVLRLLNSEDSLKLVNITNWLTRNNYAAEAKEVNLFVRTWQPATYSLQTDKFINCELNDTKWLAFRNHASARLKHMDISGKSRLIFRYKAMLPGGIVTMHLDSPKGPVLLSMKMPPTKDAGWEVSYKDFPASVGTHDIYFSYENPNLTDPDNSGMLFDWFYFTNPFPGENINGYDSTLKNYWYLVKNDMPAMPVMFDNPAEMVRATNVFERGNWLVKGRQVQPDIPASLGGLPAGFPKNRLGLALWLTDKKNPLTARTMVNRLWEQIFGAGLVETLEDLGTQGADPTHKELLDHLSYKFMFDFNWDIKKLLKEIVMSATYRQASKVSNEVLEKDPYNRYYSRGSRVRLSAEQIRDQALFISGLLSTKMYGPSVMPWQPEGIWMSPWNGAYWKTSEGGDKYRRAIYTYWKRTAPYPSMISFDGVGREVCTSRRIRTNTPLQALVTLNDSAYIEMSKHFALRMINESRDKNNISEVIGTGYGLMMYKKIDPGKLKVLETLYHTALQRFKEDRNKMFDLIGEKGEHAKPELAAMIVVANAMLNLDDLITRS